ncbi:MAG: cupredoxin domain-containing protein [Ignavibacteriae bacterium]|nr:cupredoxin domain-containing protein [Ignavibacteriota bacterium]
MKYFPIIILIVLFMGNTFAVAQCGMHSSGSHQQKKTSSHEQHSNQQQSLSSKGFAFINDDGIQEATIVIKDGYQPSTLVVKKNIPLRLNFDLQEESCTGTVVFKDFHIKQVLEPYELTSVEFTPAASGSFTFACPMNMIEGVLVVKE